ncbi:MAG: SDR family oxidoreductase [Rhodobacteraceae bacterium]|nr:SDR family oxidoreductase [Paracoccaceae bacterium]
MSFSIAGRTAIVTGAANGIGLAIARRFLDADANVVFADMDEGRLEAEVGDLAAREERARLFAGDLRQRLTQANLLSATIDAFDRVDILVNASRQVLHSDPLDARDESLETMLAQNLVAGLRLSQLVAARMIRQAEGAEDDGPSTAGAGAIVNLSSIAARVTRPELLGYSVACAALDQATRSLAVALAPHRIRVNAIAFGSVMSSSLKAVLRNDEAARQEIIARTPLGRIARPEEVAEAAQYLASDSACFVTGHVLTMDGGRSLLDPVALPSH